MNYYISESVDLSKTNSIFLRPDNWDDYRFRTTFLATYVDIQREPHNLGSIKIGVCGATNEETFRTRNVLESHFERLPANTFSLWQSADTYQKVREIVVKSSCNIFADLNDISYNLDLLEKYWHENIMQNSLTRSINRSTIEDQFHRITLGHAKLTKYNFAYEIKNEYSEITLKFDVNPNSCPPTNIHVLIGGNGIGKTTLIREMIDGILNNDCESSKGRFIYDFSESTFHSAQFANVICVGFSPFDDFSSLEKYDKKLFSYIGTKKEYPSSETNNEDNVTNLLDDIENQFIDSMKSCLSNLTKREDLSDVISILEADPMFYNYRISELIVPNDTNVDYNNEGMTPFRNIFSNMSSGHKVVLSTIVRCIDKMVEKTILFLDEPENHLHPPLLSSLIRSISTVLMKRNGVAIISTHSPIVLQETPKSCVWLLSRSGDVWNASRPRFETFGENIGSLTNDVFKYEINKSGFHALIKESVLVCDTYEEVLDIYDNQLGDEARGLVRVLLAQKERGEL